MDNEWPTLDFSLFPHEAITGLTLREINEIMKEDMSGIPAFDEDYLDGELHTLPDEIQNLLNETENSMKPTSTAIQEKLHSSKFMTFLKNKNMRCDLKSVSEEKLNDYLRYFYHELRTQNGQYYSPASLKCIRAGIHRHITQTLNRTINIINDSKFASSNRMLTAMAGMWLSHGGEKKQYEKIEESDMNKMFSYFKRSTGEELQNEVIFSLLFYLGARGREELRRVKRHDLCFDTDSDCVKYAFLKTTNDDISEPNNIRKNVKASLKEKEYNNQRSNRIYDRKAIECFEIYLRRLEQDAPESGSLPTSCKQQKFKSFLQQQASSWGKMFGKFH